MISVGLEHESSCAICRANRNLEVHHIVSRGMGGSSRPEIETPENKITICRSCHTEITEHRWNLTRTERELTVVAVASGEMVARRLLNSGFDAPTFLAKANLIELDLDALLPGIPYLTDEQIVELFQQVRSIDKGAWKAQAALLWEAKQRSVHGARAWEGIGRTFGIGWRQAYNLARVWDTFFKGDNGEFCNRLQNSSLEESTWFVVAAETQAPHFWLAYAEDQKAEQPSYSIADFKDEIRIAGAREADTEGGNREPGTRCRWLRAYCEKLDRMVRPGECPGCDTLSNAIQEALR